MPPRPWVRLLLASTCVVACLALAWEAHVRAQGYAPTQEDGPDLWAYWRSRALGAPPDQVVLAGSSRSLFDMHLDTWAAQTRGPKPIQLAMAGSSPVPVLAELAQDPGFRATVLVDVMPLHFFSPFGPPVDKPRAWIERHGEWSPAQRFGLAAGLLLEGTFAFMEQYDLTLPALVRRAPLPERRGSLILPRLPYLSSLDRYRQAAIAERVLRDPRQLEAYRRIWVPMFERPATPKLLTEAQFLALLEEAWVDMLADVRNSVRLIEGRGGRVIFVRSPSSGRIRQLEAEVTPREDFWERILSESGAPGIHFEDHPELVGFECPEWSHLSPDDAVRFTRRLIPLLVDNGWVHPRARAYRPSRASSVRQRRATPGRIKAPESVEVAR